MAKAKYHLQKSSLIYCFLSIIPLIYMFFKFFLNICTTTSDKDHIYGIFKGARMLDKNIFPLFTIIILLSISCGQKNKDDENKSNEELASPQVEGEAQINLASAWVPFGQAEMLKGASECLNFTGASQSENIVLIGDSITHGLSSKFYENPLYYNMSGFINTSAKVINTGTSGIRIEQVVNQIPLLNLATCKPKDVLIMLGANNLRIANSDADITTALNSYRQLVDYIKSQSPQTNIHIQSVLPMESVWSQTEVNIDAKRRIPAFNYHLRNLANEKGFKYIDLYSSFMNWSSLNQSYYLQSLEIWPAGYALHLGQNGYRRWKSILETQFVETRVLRTVSTRTAQPIEKSARLQSTAAVLTKFFDEAYYKLFNPDVAWAIQYGFMSSGEAHYNMYGKNEWWRPYRYMCRNSYGTVQNCPLSM